MYGNKLPCVPLTELNRLWKVRRWNVSLGSSRSSGQLRNIFGRSEASIDLIKSFRPSYLAPFSRTIERGILYLTRGCFGLWLKERGILHLKRAKWLENRGRSNRGEMTGYPLFSSRRYFNGLIELKIDLYIKSRTRACWLARKKN